MSVALPLSAVLSFAVGLSLSAPRVAQAGVADWFTPSDTSKTKKAVKKPVKKSGMFQSSANKKPTTATGRMIDSVMSGPNKMMKSSMSALVPTKKQPPNKYRSVPRTMVSEKKEPSMLKRLFTTPEPEKPLTVGQWMAQPRPKP